MTSRTHSLDVFSDGEVLRSLSQPTPDRWQFLPSPDPIAAARSLGTAPAVIVLADGVKRVEWTHEWQKLLIRINPSMTRHNIAGLLGDHKAFTNRTGITDGVYNFIEGENLFSTKYPQCDKVRTCADAIHTGRVVGAELVLITLDGNQSPPLDVTPGSHPWLFFRCVITDEEGNLDPFPTSNMVRDVWFPLVACVQIRVPLAMVRVV